MVLIGFLGVGIVTGLIASAILGRNGYSVIGEILLGILGAVVLGMLAGVIYGMRSITLESLAASTVGSTVVLALAVGLTLRARGESSSRRPGSGD